MEENILQFFDQDHHQDIFICENILTEMITNVYSFVQQTFISKPVKT